MSQLHNYISVSGTFIPSEISICFINNNCPVPSVGKKLTTYLVSADLVIKLTIWSSSSKVKHTNDEGKALILQCKNCKGKISHADRSEDMRSHLCCASYVLSQEEDFLEQEEWLAEVVKKAGFNILFYPKYHCELN
jgi:hypothetical protein